MLKLLVLFFLDWKIFIKIFSFYLFKIGFQTQRLGRFFFSSWAASKKNYWKQNNFFFFVFLFCYILLVFILNKKIYIKYLNTNLFISLFYNKCIKQSLVKHIHTYTSIQNKGEMFWKKRNISREIEADFIKTKIIKFFLRNIKYFLTFVV